MALAMEIRRIRESEISDLFSLLCFETDCLFPSVMYKEKVLGPGFVFCCSSRALFLLDPPSTRAACVTDRRMDQP